jgi:hypothetical protein
MFENFGFSNDKYGLLSCIYIELLYPRSTPSLVVLCFGKKPLLIVADGLSYGFKKKHRRHGSKGYF